MEHTTIDDLPLLWRTAHEIIISKPSGMATELTSDPKGISLVARVRAIHPRAKLPHRLDRVTRGIVLVALTDEAIRWHNEQIRAGAWAKVYLARVQTSPDLDALIGVHKLHLKRVGERAEIVRSGGKRALTEIVAWAPAPETDDEAHVLIRLHTGRFHQIRATMAHLGAPLVDDWVYGTSPGREQERFYLEHVALRFEPCEGASTVAVHWGDDPGREAVAAELRGVLDDLLAQWDAEGSRRIGGADATQC